LVPGVADLITLFGEADMAFLVNDIPEGRHTGVGHLISHPLGQLGGDGEGTVDPAVGVHDTTWDAIVDARDRSSEEAHRYEDGACQKEAERQLVMEPECRIVDETRFLGQKLAKSAESSRDHFDPLI